MRKSKLFRLYEIALQFDTKGAVFLTPFFILFLQTEYLIHGEVFHLDGIDTFNTGCKFLRRHLRGRLYHTPVVFLQPVIELPGEAVSAVDSLFMNIFIVTEIFQRFMVRAPDISAKGS